MERLIDAFGFADVPAWKQSVVSDVPSPAITRWFVRLTEAVAATMEKTACEPSAAPCRPRLWRPYSRADVPPSMLEEAVLTPKMNRCTFLPLATSAQPSLAPSH